MFLLFKNCFLDLKRVCSRCGAEYRLTPDGNYATVENSCTFHWGKAWKKLGTSILKFNYCF